MMKIEVEGICRYCGQVQIVRAAEALTQDEIDDMATRDCACPGARKGRAMEELENSIAAALGENSVAAGMDYALEEDAIDQARALGGLIWDEGIREATFRERFGDTIRLSKKDGRIRLTRIHRKQIQL